MEDTAAAAAPAENRPKEGEDAAVADIKTSETVVEANNGGEKEEAVSYTHLTLPTTPYV